MGTTKVDLRIDDDLLETVREIALHRFNAKVHHISHKPEVTGAINQLIRYGIEYLEKGYQDSDRSNPIVYPDNVVTQELLESAIAPLMDEFNRLNALRSEFQELKMKVEDLKIVLDPDGNGRFLALLEEFKDQLLTRQEMLERDSISDNGAAPINYFPEIETDARSTAIAVDDGQNESQVVDKEAESKISAIQGNLLESTETTILNISGDKDEKRVFSRYTDLESLTTRQLRPMANNANIKGSRTMSKAQLIEALRAEAEKTKLSVQ